MSTPTGDNAFLRALELNVRTELTLAETSQPWEEAVGVPIDEWLSDPADDQRYEVGLRSLLGAVEALENGSGPAAILRRAKNRRASLQRGLCQRARTGHRDGRLVSDAGHATTCGPVRAIFRDEGSEAHAQVTA
jgi:hypothetical protein